MAIGIGVVQFTGATAITIGAPTGATAITIGAPTGGTAITIAHSTGAIATTIGTGDTLGATVAGGKSPFNLTSPNLDRPRQRAKAIFAAQALPER
jgi:hypothetical protein